MGDVMYASKVCRYYFSISWYEWFTTAHKLQLILCLKLTYHGPAVGEYDNADY